jgi:hypothetical protein
VTQTPVGDGIGRRGADHDLQDRRQRGHDAEHGGTGRQPHPHAALEGSPASRPARHGLPAHGA